MYIERSFLEQTDPCGNVLQSGGTRKKIRLFFRCCKNSCNLSEIRTPAIYGHTKKVIFPDVNAKFYALTLKFDEVSLSLMIPKLFSWLKMTLFKKSTNRTFPANTTRPL